MVRFVEDGGDRTDSEPVAPVIPLFGGSAPKKPRVDSARAAGWHSTWDAPGPDGERSESRAAAVTSFAARERPSRADRETTQRAAAPERSAHEAAENRLLKKLRTRSLSISEARSVLREGDLDAPSIDDMIDEFERRGYLDDAALAEQLVHSAVDRKGQGRRAIAQTLAKRGVPRDVADAAIASLPDDDADRALDFARSKARAMRDLDRDTALRRLAGQLARRGYGAQSLSAARIALDEVR